MLHSERDHLYEQISKLTIEGDLGTLEEHVATIVEAISDEQESNHTTPAVILEKNDLTQFHKTNHAPVQLSKQQAICLKLLAQGQTSKEIARTMHISYRTVEGYIGYLIDKLGCNSSKDLIAIYHKRP